MAKSTKALLTGRIQKCKTNPSIAHIGLATHGRSIQIGSSYIGNAVYPNATKSPDYLWTACRAIQGWLMNKRASSDAEPRPMR